ncbi:hypothetical protein [Aliikangiella sp. IMCC44359]|uniref:hypothetical protein n=1 Tax=Aliikangiella sp. IMCC44359 TaxID=3459125 RepID=UPI00403B0157
MQLPPNDFSNQFKKQTEQLLIDARNLLGLSGELLGTYLTKLNTSKEQYQIYSLCCNYFQMEHRFNLQLNQMGIDIFNYQYNTDMLINVPLVKCDFVSFVNQFINEVQSGKQTLITPSPNRGCY